MRPSYCPCGHRRRVHVIQRQGCYVEDCSCVRFGAVPPAAISNQKRAARARVRREVMAWWRRTRRGAAAALLLLTLPSVAHATDLPTRTRNAEIMHGH